MFGLTIELENTPKPNNTKIIFCIVILSLFVFVDGFATSSVLIEAESFEEKGGWVVDQQFMDVMGSPFLLAHGLGCPVAPARTVVELPAFGEYRVFVRTRDWVAPQGPGQFAVAVNGTRLPVTFGVGGTGEWAWWDGGSVAISNVAAVAVELIDLTGFEGRCDALLFVPTHEAGNPFHQPQGDFAWRRELLRLPTPPPFAGEFDFVVVGGGYAGMCAAVAAARLGVKVALVQDRPVLGGNASGEVRVGPIGYMGLKPFPRNSDILYEIRRLSKMASPNGVEQSLEDWIRAEKNLSLFLSYRVCEVVTDGGRIKSVTARHIETSKELMFEGRFFADCTGDGTVGFLAGAEFRAGSESREETGETFASPDGKRRYLGATNYWRTRWAESDTPFPECPWALPITEGALDVSTPKWGAGVGSSSAAPPPYTVSWNWESGFDRDQVSEAEYIRDYNFRAMYGVWDFLKNKSKDKDRYRKAELEWAAYIMGKRESRRLMGDYILTQDDLVQHRVYEDGCVTATWYLDIHYPHPENTKYFPGSEFRSMALDDPNVKALRTDIPNEQVEIRPYPIPFRCFYSRNVDNLFMAGRNMSGTHIALSSPRVMNTTAQMGAVVGRAAALCVVKGCSPRDLYAIHWGELKKLLANPGRQTELSVAEEKTMRCGDTFIGEIKWQFYSITGLHLSMVVRYTTAVLLLAVVLMTIRRYFNRKKAA